VRSRKGWQTGSGAETEAKERFSRSRRNGRPARVEVQRALSDAQAAPRTREQGTRSAGSDFAQAQRESRRGDKKGGGSEARAFGAGVCAAERAQAQHSRDPRGRGIPRTRNRTGAGSPREQRNKVDQRELESLREKLGDRDEDEPPRVRRLRADDEEQGQPTEGATASQESRDGGDHAHRGLLVAGRANTSRPARAQAQAAKSRGAAPRLDANTSSRARGKGPRPPRSREKLRRSWEADYEQGHDPAQAQATRRQEERAVVSRRTPDAWTVKRGRTHASFKSGGER